jgi:hypothetical protein
MMNECKKIEPLLYLHRNGEMSEKERKDVEEHLEQCPSCCAIAAQLHSIDEALVPVRTASAAAQDNPVIIGKILQRITAERISAQRGNHIPSFDYFLRLRPAFSCLLVMIIVLFFAQQVRDAHTLAVLERRLHTEGHVTAGRGMFSDERSMSSVDMQSLRRASGPGNVLDILTSEYPELFHDRNELFGVFASRYPHLAHITLNNGVDKQEKEILSTEGKQFLKEFDHLLREGDLNHETNH